MTKYLLQVIKYTLILVFVILVLNYIYKSGFYVKSETYDLEEEKFWSMPDSIEVCNFGSSHGQEAFNYEDITDVVCFNFALPSQSLSYDLRILKYYQKKLSDDAFVVITISPFAFYGEAEADREYFDSMNKRYYKFLPKEYVKKYDRRTAFFYHDYPLLASEWIEKAADRIIDKVTHNMQVRAFMTTSSDEASIDGIDKFEDYIESRKTDDGRRIYNDEEIHALYEMISICESEGFHTVLITTPFLSEYNDAVKERDPGFEDDFNQIIQNVVSNTGVKYYDFSNDPRFTYDYTLFWDSVHLNKQGADKFTEIVFKDVLGISR